LFHLFKQRHVLNSFVHFAININLNIPVFIATYRLRIS
jgi:hypothetical protein